MAEVPLLCTAIWYRKIENKPKTRDESVNIRGQPRDLDLIAHSYDSALNRKARSNIRRYRHWPCIADRLIACLVLWEASSLGKAARRTLTERERMIRRARVLVWRYEATCCFVTSIRHQKATRCVGTLTLAPESNTLRCGITGIALVCAIDSRWSTLFVDYGNKARRGMHNFHGEDINAAITS